MFSLKSKVLMILAPAVDIIAVAGGAYAFTAANNVPDPAAGQGAAALSGYDISNLVTAQGSGAEFNDVATVTLVVAPAADGRIFDETMTAQALTCAGPVVLDCAVTLGAASASETWACAPHALTTLKISDVTSYEIVAMGPASSIP